MEWKQKSWNIQKSSVALLVFEKGNFIWWKSNKQAKQKNIKKKNLHHFHPDDKIQSFFLNKQMKLHCHQIHHVTFYDLNSIDWDLMINHARPVTIKNKNN